MARSSKELEAEVFAILRAGLEHLGFRKRAGLRFTRDQSPDVLGVISFPASLGRAGVYIDMSSNIGVRFDRLERMLAAMEGTRIHPYLPVTIMEALLALMPKSGRTSWSFDNTMPVTSEAEDLLSAIRDFGLPYVERHASLDAVVEAGYRMHKSPQLAYRLPMALLLQGKTEEARQVVGEKLAGIGDREDVWAKNYRAFADRFRKSLEAPT